MDTDVVVVLPGIMGSTLGVRTADSPAAASLVWAPTAGAVWNNVSGRLRIQDFRVPDGVGDGHPGDGVEPVGLMPDVHALPGVWTPVKGYTPLVKRLESLGYREYRSGDAGSGNLVLAAYDWRLSNRLNGQRLAGIVEPALDRWRARGGRFAQARLVFVCHSMGGLVARWYLERCGGAGHTRKLITLGTPWRGAGKAVEQLVNGVTPGIGPVHVSLTEFARSLPSLYQLLPEYACLTDGPRNYVKTTEAATTLPLPTGQVADAMDFYTTLQDAERARPGSQQMTHTLVGTRQPTVTTITINPDRTATVSESFGSVNDYGDGTVPLTGAIGHDQNLDTPSAVRFREQHGNLQRNPFVLDQVEEILTTEPVRRRATHPLTLRVHTPELIPDGQPLDIDIHLEPATGQDDDAPAQRPRAAVRVAVIDESGKLLQARQPTVTDGHAHANLTGLPAGAHTIIVDSPPTQAGPAMTQPNYGGPIQPVTATTLIWPTE